MINLLKTFVLAFSLAAPSLAFAQDGPENLQYFPTDMTREEIVAEMGHFSFALGVRCQHCHERNPDGRGFDFSSDANPNKEKARVMLFMTDQINRTLASNLAERSNPPVVVICKTCHRGSEKPRLLWQEMLLAAHEGGAEAAIDRFDYLRENYDNTGTYDFREQEVNVAAEELAAEGMHEEAIIIFQMNAGRFPSSEAPWVGIGESYEALGDAAGAIEAYEKALSLNANRRDVIGRLEELRGQ